MYESQSQSAKREREASDHERANVKAQLRAQIANQASWAFILLNAGGLAALLTWMQALPLQPEVFSCNYILIRTLPWVAGLLLLGILATVMSYIFRYRATFSETGDLGWMIALTTAAACLLIAGVWISYSVINCQTIASDARLADYGDQALARVRLATSNQERWQLLQQEYRVASDGLKLAILEAQLRETVELEKKLARVRYLKNEMSRRIELYGPTGSSQFEAQLRRASELEKTLEDQFRPPPDPAMGAAAPAKPR
jgi:hypothetical protein